MLKQRNWGLSWVFATLSAISIASAANDGKAEDGWVTLFNGEDLTGWKKHPDDKANWQVVEGKIIGTGPAGHLFSERGDYANFHFRIQAMINDGGNSGQYFRATFTKGFPPGYEAQINSTNGDPIRTGSLYPDRLTSDNELNKTIIYDQLAKPNEWFTQEVIAIGNHIVIKLNGKTTVDFWDVKKRHAKGHFAIQQHNEGSIISVRKVEIKELP